MNKELVDLTYDFMEKAADLLAQQAKENQGTIRVYDEITEFASIIHEAFMEGGDMGAAEEVIFLAWFSDKFEDSISEELKAGQKQAARKNEKLRALWSKIKHLGPFYDVDFGDPQQKVASDMFNLIKELAEG